MEYSYGLHCDIKVLYLMLYNTPINNAFYISLDWMLYSTSSVLILRLSNTTNIY